MHFRFFSNKKTSLAQALEPSAAPMIASNPTPTTLTPQANPKDTKSPGRRETLKNLFLFLSAIASDAPVPGIKAAFHAILGTIQRIDSMNENDATKDEIAQDIEAFTYMLRGSDGVIDPSIIIAFHQACDEINSEIDATLKISNKSRRKLYTHKIIGFVNALPNKDLIEGIRKRLDAAVQKLQAGLLISQARETAQFKQWVQGLEKNMGNKETIAEYINFKADAQGNMRMEVKNDAKAVLHVDGSTFQAKGFSHKTVGENANTRMCNTTITSSDGDIDLITSSPRYDK